jgi:AraC-like DNA-binding protein
MAQPSYHEKKKLEVTFPFLSWEIDSRSFPLHWHDCFEIMVISQGSMDVFINDSIFEVSAGDMVMINSGAVHGFFDSHVGTIIDGFQFDVTLFDESFINLRDILFQNPILGQNIKKAGICAQLRRLFQEILHENTEKILGYQLAVKAKLYEFMLTILRELPQHHSETTTSKSKQVIALVLKNADDPDFTLEEAAETLRLNKFYFSHLFKKYTGQSFHSYLVQTRITFAKHYLVESEMSITDIAFQSGFNSIQTFNRVFKSSTGFTPRDYRHENSAPPVNVNHVFHHQYQRNAKFDTFSNF